MSNFKITYGLKGEEKVEVVAFPHLGEAMEEAQNRAMKIFYSTEKGQKIKEEMKSRYTSDPYLSIAYTMQAADDYVDYFAEEMFSKNSTIYLVTNQLSAFSNVNFIHITLKEAIELLKPLKEIGLDSETDGLDVHTNKMLLLQLGIKEFQIVFDIASFNNKIPESLREFLREDRLYLFQNAKFDLQFLFKQDIILRNVYDTMLTEIIITNGLDSKRSLDVIVGKYCGITLNKETRKEFTTVGITDRGIKYAADDVKYLPEVKKKQLEIVAKWDLQKAVDLDNVFVIALAYTEYCGIKLDYNKWLKKTANKKELLLKYRKEITEHLKNDGMHSYFNGMNDLFSGEMECTVNWNSPTQVKKLFLEYGINLDLYDKGTLKQSTKADVLKPQVNDFPILKPYLKYKEMQKEVSTYGESWEKYINPKTGRIHPSFWQLNVTGRLSSGGGKGDFDSPNMQNLPADAETRACFIAEPGNLMIDADYSGQEQIILANFSKEKGLLEFYGKGFTDMHSYVAFLMYEDIRRCSVKDITPEELEYIKKNYVDRRIKAKAAGFAVNYGGNGATIARNCSISKKEGDFVYNSYFESFPDLKKYFTNQFNKAAYFGYIEFNVITKRKFFFDKETHGYFKYHARVSDKYFWMNEGNAKEIFKLYNKDKGEMQRYSQNYPSQGTAGDVTKFAAVLFLREILARGWWMKVLLVNQVHDELLVECPKDITEEVSEVLIDCMERAGVPFCKILPLKADTIIADHWKH